MENKLSVKESNEMTKPSFLNGEEVESNIQMDASDIKVAAISLGQGLSEAVQQGDVKIGEYYNSLTLQNYGKELEIIVIKHEKRWSLFDGKKFIKSSADGIYWSDGEKLSADETWACMSHNFWVLIRSDLNPIPSLVTFRSTSSKEGKNLLNLLYRNSKLNNEPIFARSYVLKSEKATGNKGDYFIKVVQPKGYISEEEYKFAKEVAKNINKMNIDDVKGAEEDQSIPAEADDIVID